MLKFRLADGIEELGLVSINQAGAIVYCNATFEAMLGFEEGAPWVLGWAVTPHNRQSRHPLSFSSQVMIHPPAHLLTHLSTSQVYLWPRSAC